MECGPNSGKLRTVVYHDDKKFIPCLVCITVLVKLATCRWNKNDCRSTLT
jgi:hypothetical protein